VPVLDDPSAYYAPPQDDWSLGDIVVVPTVALWARAERHPDDARRPAPSPDGAQSVVYNLWRGVVPFADPVAECWLTPAMITVDDCVLDKEFNAFIEQRMKDGLAESEAEAEARALSTLDALVPVTPILPFRGLQTNEAAIRTGQPVGYFPIVESDVMDAGYLDFVRTVPVSRHLLWGPVAALSESARRILRWKLAQFYGFRNLSVDAEIMAAIGKVITATRVVTDNKNRLVVDLELDHDAGHLQLRQEPRRADLPSGHQRQRP